MATGTTAIRSPTDDLSNHTIVLRQLKEVAEVGQRLRGDPTQSFVKISELVNAGVIRFINNVVQGPSSSASAIVSVADSIQGGGTSASPLELVGDAASPGNSMLYGTNGSGTKGWYPQPSGGSTTLAGLSDVLISSPANGQVLTYISSTGKWENQASSGGGGGNITPDSHPSSATAWDDEFEFGSSIDTTGARFAGANAWTAFNLSTGTTAVANGSLVFSPALTASRNFGGYSQPAPSGSYTITAKTLTYNVSTGSAGGLFFGTTTAGKLVHFSVVQNQLVVQALTNFNTFSANQSGPTAVFIQIATSPPIYTGYVYLQIKYDGTNLIFLYSLSGVAGTFLQFFSETAASFLGGAPSLVGFGCDNESATNQTQVIMDWFRRTA